MPNLSSEQNKSRQFNILSNFWIKVIALVTMTFDHVGYFLMQYTAYDNLATTFRIIGRLALPLFCFLIVEGVIHTKNFLKYILRLSILAMVITVAQIVLKYGFKDGNAQGNIFLDLILGAVAVKCLMDKRIGIKFLAIIPLGIGVLSHFFYAFEYASYPIAQYYPNFLRPQYSYYGILLIVAMYCAYPLTNGFMKLIGLDSDLYEGTNLKRIYVNAFMAGMIVIVSLIYYLIALISLNTGNDIYVYWNYTLQNYAMLSGIIVLFYSGTLGYRKTWFNVFSYLYYPVHLLTIYLIFMLIFH